MFKPTSISLSSTLLLAVVLTAKTKTQSTATASVQWFPAELVGKQLAAGKPWLSLLDTATLSLGRYRLRAGSQDGQAPHVRDEVYHVLAGSARFRAGSATRSVGLGDSIFVAAGVRHQFLDIEADLDLLVFFSAAKAPTGGMAAGPRPTGQTAYPETSQRGNTRIFYWFQSDSAGQVAIDFGQPRWQQQYDRFLTAPSGKRWRCGENSWTTLDTNMPLTIAGVAVPVGAYYAVLEHTRQDGVRLVLLAPSEVRKRRLDAYQAGETTGGLSIPLQLGKAAVAASRLSIELSVAREQRDHGVLHIRFGPHELAAPVVNSPTR